MKTRIIGVAALLIFQPCGLAVMPDTAAADASKPVTSAKPAAPAVRIVLAGDSTVTDRAGWGHGFRQFLGDGAECINTSHGGRSSKSFIDEGRWAPALALKGDYYLLQFGHNDVPGKGPARETDPATTYTQNMARYVDDVRAIGATPVLVTSLTVREFDPKDPGKIRSRLTPYAEAVKKLAADKAVLLIDLHARSIGLCERLGPDGTAKLNPFKKPGGESDTTHLDAHGSVVFARLVVAELRKVAPGLAPFLREEPLAPEPAELHEDIEYGRAGGEKLLLDASVPVGDGPFPVAILVHGGGWANGDKRGSDRAGNVADITPWFAPLTAAKFTWFSINYRLAPAHRWPACLEDVQAAIRWVKAHAAGFKGDPNRIVLFGHSAGGHLVCLAATLAGEDTRVQAVVGYAPGTDLEDGLKERGGLGPALQRLFERPKEITPEALAQVCAASPISHVKPGLPPFLLVHGDADESVTYRQSIAFQASLRASGVPCELITIPGGGHGLFDWPRHAPDYTDRVIAWLRKTLDVPLSAAGATKD